MRPNLFRVLKYWTASVIAGLLASSALAKSQSAGCHKVVLEGQVAAGQGFDRVFAKGLRFYLEPLRSGWIVRVLDAGAPRGPHDYAELATPPYQSVSPLLISTDWSFRAQDAIAWNPRHFRFAADRAAFRALERLQPGTLAGDSDAQAKLANIISVQPEAVLEVLDAGFAPGLADQARMASTVALHLGNTPHTVDKTANPSALGRLEYIRFRALLGLPPGVRAMTGLKEQSIPCFAEPTSSHVLASH